MTAQQVREYLLEADVLSAYEEIDQHCGASAITSEAKDHLQVRQDCGIYGSRTQTISKVAESEAEHASSVSLEWSSVGSVSYSGPVCSSTTYQHYRVASAEGSGDGSNGVQMAAVTVPLSGAGDGSSLMIAIQPGFEDGSYSAADKWDLFGETPSFIAVFNYGDDALAQAGGTVAVSRLEDEVQMTLAVELVDGSELTGEIWFHLPQ